MGKSKDEGKAEQEAKPKPADPKPMGKTFKRRGTEVKK